jgi:hypothetical protein
MPIEQFGTIVSLVPDIEFRTIQLDETNLQQSILNFLRNRNSPNVDFVSLAAKVLENPHYLQILQTIAKRMFDNPITATKVLKAASLYTTDLHIWLPEAATTTLWRWPPYYHQWVNFWLSVKDIPPPEILLDAINNGDSAGNIIEKLDRDAYAEGNVTVIAMVFVRGEGCLAYRCQDKLIWRTQQGDEFSFVPFDRIVMDGDAGEVVMGEERVVFEAGLEYFI